MFEISMMPDFPYKNAWGTLSLGVEEIDLWCVFYINSQLASTNPSSDQFIWYICEVFFINGCQGFLIT